MSNLNEDIRNKILEWVSYADDDLIMAKHGLTIEIGNPYKLIAFHAQQCVEKYLKAYLIHRKIDFPFTHDISQLLELCLKVTDMVEEIMDARKLTIYASTLRYPGIDRIVSKSEAISAVDIAIRVRDVVRRSLLEDGIALNE
jgi:HEPN domain-containing protein